MNDQATDTLTTALIQAFDTQSREILAGAGLPEVKRLCQYLKVASIEVLPPKEPIPAGFAAQVVSPTVAVYVDVKDAFVVDEQIKKAQAALEDAAKGVQEQRKILDGAEFAQKSSAAAQEAEKKKHDDFMSEQKTWEHIIEQFHTMKLDK